jgi:hypothetical protein
MQTTAQPSTAGAADAAAQGAQATSAAPAQAPLVATSTAAAEGAYEAARAARNELRSQLDALVSQRHGFLREIEDHEEVTGPAISGMQQRIVQLDARIAQLDLDIAAADAAVARTAAVPGAVVHPLEVIRREGPPEEVFFLIPILGILAMMPIVFAFARRIWRRSSVAPAQLPADLTDRLARLEQMGETTALEVERIGEGQRFVTRLLTERADKVLSEGAAESRR